MGTPVLSPILQSTEIDPSVLMPTQQANQFLLDLEQGALGEITIALADADLILSAPQLKHYTFVFTGTLTANRNIKVPAVARPFDVFNDTVGGFSLVFETVSGTGVTVKNGLEQILRCDGVNVIAVAPSLVPGASGGVVYPTRILTSGASTTMSAAIDYLLVVRKSVGSATTVNLEPGVFEIKDGKGDAATNPITVQAAADVSPGNGLIDGASTYVISTDRGSARFAYDGTGFNVL